MAGAARYDKMCHSVFSGNGDGSDFLLRGTSIHCGSCGRNLSVYYCEEGLFLVSCECCKKRALVKAKNPKEAAYKTFAHKVVSMGIRGISRRNGFCASPPTRTAGVRQRKSCRKIRRTRLR